MADHGELLRRWPTSVPSRAHRAPVPSSATCVAVGDDGGGHVASIIVTDERRLGVDRFFAPAGGDDAVGGVVSSASSLLRRWGRWHHQVERRWGAAGSCRTPSFPAESISCVTIDECTAVGGNGIARNHRWIHMESANAPPGIERSRHAVSCPNSDHLRGGRDVVDGVQQSSAPQDGSDWTTTGPRLPVNLLDIHCRASFATTCVWRSELRSGSGAITLSNDERSRLGRPTSLDPNRHHSWTAVACPERRQLASQLAPTSARRPYVIGTSNSGSTWTLAERHRRMQSTSPGSRARLTEDCIAVGNTRQRRSWVDDHGDDNRWVVVDGPEVRRQARVAEFNLVSEQQRCALLPA